MSSDAFSRMASDAFSRMVSDAFSQMASDAFSRMASDVFDRENDDKSSFHYPDLGQVHTSRHVINGGKPNILRPIVTWSVSCEYDIGRVGTLPFLAGAKSAS